MWHIWNDEVAGEEVTPPPPDSIWFYSSSCSHSSSRFSPGKIKGMNPIFVLFRKIRPSPSHQHARASEAWRTSLETGASAQGKMLHLSSKWIVSLMHLISLATMQQYSEGSGSEPGGKGILLQIWGHLIPSSHFWSLNIQSSICLASTFRLSSTTWTVQAANQGTNTSIWTMTPRPPKECQFLVPEAIGTFLPRADDPSHEILH